MGGAQPGAVDRAAFGWGAAGIRWLTRGGRGTGLHPSDRREGLGKRSESRRVLGSDYLCSPDFVKKNLSNGRLKRVIAIGRAV